ncbi:transporter substrate-binding domain-containing protein [Tumidithrix helvetica]|uniref:transporter substrate-binding domain-containing protein n=1 Tax=Tumidithrix helvetica TaxID=3457545 RepID=UPI003CC64B95
MKNRSRLLTLFVSLPLLLGGVSTIYLPEAIASDWATVQTRGRLLVGVKDYAPPLSFRDASGQWKGFEIDIAKKLAKELLGSEQLVEFVPLTNRDRLPALWNNRVDLAIAQISVTHNRTRLVDFTLPYYTDGTALVVARGIRKQDFTQTKGIAVIKNSATIAVLQYHFPKMSLIGVNSYQEGLAALKDGKVQAFAGDSSALVQWLKENPDYESIDRFLSHHSLAIALPKGLQYIELRERVLKTMERWRKNGWLRDRATYWGLP